MRGNESMSSHTTGIILMSILILFSYISLGLPSGLFPAVSRLDTEMLFSCFGSTLHFLSILSSLLPSTQ